MNARHRFVTRLAWFLDESIRLPGGYRVGIDGFIGLVPGIGDLVGGLLSSVIVYHANRIGVPRIVLARMVINMLIDTVVGAVPIAGDLFDFVWKANKRNIALLQQYQADPDTTRRRSTIQTSVFVLILLAVVGLLVAMVVTVLTLVWSALVALATAG